MIVLSLVLAGCGDRSQRPFRQEKRQFAIVMTSKLNQFQKRAADLAVEVREDSVRVAEVEGLRDRHSGLREKITTIDGATEGQWKEMKPALEAEYYDLERRFYEIAGAAATQKAVEASDSLGTAGSLDPAGARYAPGAAAPPAGTDSLEILRGR